VFDARMVCELSCDLGEGPAWDAREDCLWFVDINNCLMHRYGHGSSRVVSWEAPSKVGWVAPAVPGRLLTGLREGTYSFDPHLTKFVRLAQVEPLLSYNILNDATVDRDGTISFGSMDEGGARRTGRFYRFDGREMEALAIHKMPITNGPALSPDGRRLYYVDTLSGGAFDTDIPGQAFPLAHCSNGAERCR
jgi:D-xylonolactonase